MKEQKMKMHDSWFYVILYSLIEMFTSFSTDSVDAGGSSSSLITADDYLGELGKKRRMKLLGMIGLFFGIILLLISIICFENQISKIICVIISTLLIILSLIYLIKRKK